MSLSIDDLQLLPATEETALAAQNCCWNSLVDGCQIYSLTLSTCHSCTNTG